MEVICQEPYEGWQGGLAAPGQGNRVLHVSDMPRLANSPNNRSWPLSTQTYLDEACADMFGRGGRGVVPESPTEWFTPLSMPTPDSDKDEDPLSDFKLAGKVTIDYGDAGTCDEGAVQKVSDKAPLVYVTASANMRLQSNTNPPESPAKFRRIVDRVD